MPRDDGAAHLRTNLLHVSSWLRAKVTRILELSGITQPQFSILREQQGHPISTQEIRERMVDSRMGDASRLVDRLAQKHLVTKSPSQTDKRLVDVVTIDPGSGAAPPARRKDAGAGRHSASDTAGAGSAA